jgi:drug/metabolite transporter (DMT)-like permease
MTPLVLADARPLARRPRQFFHIGVSGVLVHGVYLGGVFMAIKHGLPAGVTALVVGMQPLLTACGAGFLLGERVSPRQWLGLALGFAGVALVVANKLGDVPLARCCCRPSPRCSASRSAPCTRSASARDFDLRTGSVIQFLPTAMHHRAGRLASESMHIEWTPQFAFALLWLVLVLSVGAISLLNVLIRSGSAVNVASLVLPDAAEHGDDRLAGLRRNARRTGARRDGAGGERRLSGPRHTADERRQGGQTVLRILGIDPGLRITGFG